MNMNIFLRNHSNLFLSQKSKSINFSYCKTFLQNIFYVTTGGY